MRILVPVVLALLVVALGVTAIVYGGFDDAPGAQLIGLVLIIGAVVLGVRTVRRRR